MMAKEDKKESEELRDLRRQEAEITREIIDLREKLVELSKSDSINLREVQKVQESLLGLEKQKQGVQGEIYNQYGEILKSEQNHLDSVRQIVETQEELKDLTEETNEEYRKSRAVKMELLDLEDELKTKYDDLQKGVAGNIVNTKEWQFASDLVAQTTAAIEERVHGSSKEMIALGDATRKNLYTNIDLVDTLQDMDASSKAVREGKFIELSAYREELGLKKTGRMLDMLREDFERGSIKDAQGKTKYSQQDLEFIQKQIGIYENQQNALQTMVDLKQKANVENKEEAKKQAEIIEKTDRIKDSVGQTKFAAIFDGVEGAISKIPGGSALTKALGFDTFKKNITENLGGSLTKVVVGFQGGFANGMKAAGQAVMGLGKSLLMGPQAVIFATLAAVGALVALFVSLDGKTSKIQKTFGGTKVEAEKTHHAAHKLAENMKVAGVNSEQTLKAMEDVSERMGGLDVSAVMQGGNKAMQQMVSDSAVLSEKFGLSADEIGNIQTLATLTGTSVGDLVNQTTKLGKGLLTDKAAMKTLAEIPKQVTVAFKGTTQELIKAAQKAKLYGTTLESIQKIGRGMLDIESSLSAEMEARVLTGKNINFDAARNYALNGETAKLQDELLNQMGSMEDFKEMNLLQQESMAKAFGMSVEEMTTMLAKGEELKAVGLSAEKLEEKQYQNAVGLREEAEKARKLGKGALADKLLSMAAEKDSATMAEKLGDIMTKVKEKFEAIMFPIVEIIHGLFDAKEAGGGIGDVFKGIFAILTPIFDIVVGLGKIAFTVLLQPFKLLFSLLSPILDAVGSIFSVFSSGEGSVGGISDIFTKINDVMLSVYGVVNDIGSALVGALIEPSKMLWMAIVTPLWKSFQGIFNTFIGLFDVVKKAFEPLFSVNKGAKETAGFTEIIGKGFEILGKVITPIGKLIAGLIVKPLEMTALVISAIVKLFTGDVNGALKDVGSYVFKYFFGMPKMILEAIAGVIDAIFGTNLTDSVTKFFDLVKDVFGDIGTYVMNTGKLLLDYLMSPFDLISDVIDGIVQMLSGDFMGGLETIGGGIKDFIMAPFDFVSSQFDNLMGTIGKIGDKISGVMDIFGGGKDEAEKKAEETKGAGGAKPATKSASEGGAEKAAAYTQKSTGGAINPNDYPEGSKARMLAEQGDVKGLEEELAMQKGGGEDKTKTIGAAATGGVIAKGGATLVGEKGPEVVSLPQGAVVASASATKQIGSAMGSMGADTATGGESPELAVLKSIDAKMGGLLEPITKVGEAIGSVINTVSSAVKSVSSIKDALPDVGGIVSSLFGGEEKKTETAVTAAGGMLSSVGGGGESKPVSAAEKANEYTAKTTITSIPQTTTPTTTAAPPTVTGVTPGEAPSKAKGGEGDALGAKLDRLISIMESMASQPTIIKFGEKTVEEIQGKIDFKKAYNIAIDNTYGRRV
jgi:hypothetical protein